MSGILRRTIRYEVKKQDGKVRYRRFPWNIVETSQGGGWEPVSMPHQLAGLVDGGGKNTGYDPNDMIHRVDHIDFDADLNCPYVFDEKVNGKASNARIKLMGGDLVQDRTHGVS